jgi:glutaredoxin
VDKDGRVHYTQQPPPRGSAKSVQQRNLGSSSVIETSTPGYSLQQAMKNYPVTLYTSPGCKEGCPEARDLLAKRGVPFREVSVTDAPSNEALKKATGDNKVPALTVGSLVHVGYQPQAFENALDSAGYPKSAPLARQPSIPAAASTPAPAPAPTAAPAPQAEVQR